MKYLLLAATITLILFVSCKKDEETPREDEEVLLIEAHLDSLGVDYTVDSTGIYAYPLAQNPTGRPINDGRVASIFYEMKVLGSDDIIDTADSLDADTVQVRQGENAIYPIGIDRALTYMKEGEEWRFILPSSQAFGSFNFSTLIPENAIIDIRINMVEVTSEVDILDEELVLINDYIKEAELEDTVKHPLNQPELLPNGLVYKRLRAGGNISPSTGEEVSITYEGRFLDSLVFDRAAAAEPFEFALGEGLVIPALDLGVGRMDLDERALIIVPSYLAYRSSAAVIPDFLLEEIAELEIIPTFATKVGPFKPVIFEIELIGVN